MNRPESDVESSSSGCSHECEHGTHECVRHNDDGPVFAEPWEAQAFALAVKLSEEGYFTWKEWAAALADELKQAADRGEPDDGSRYYQHWLAALERLVQAKGMTDAQAMHDRKEAWAEAYRHTPHGRPVELKSLGAPPQGR